jgi:bifunctional non-homologous end joining protein LigD
MNRNAAAEEIRVGRQSVRLTRPEKVLFPEERIDKRELAEYYEHIAETMLPYLRDRPITMERFPDGIDGPRLVQKQAAAYFPRWIRTAPMSKQNGTVRHVVCQDAATLVYLANQACITPHVWLSRIDKPHQPDQMIFDLDPSGDDFGAVCGAALNLRELLKHDHLEAFVKTTGSRGLHVLVPLNRRADFDEVRAFARAIATELVESDAKHLTLEVRKDKRAGRIFIDTARNAYAQTAAPPYAVRPRPGAPVAAPLEWRELEDSRLTADRYTIHNIFERLRKRGDIWKDVARHPQALPHKRAH